MLTPPQPIELESPPETACARLVMCKASLTTSYHEYLAEATSAICDYALASAAQSKLTCCIINEWLGYVAAALLQWDAGMGRR